MRRPELFKCSGDFRGVDGPAPGDVSADIISPMFTFSAEVVSAKPRRMFEGSYVARCANGGGKKNR